jgi:patatin-like phospholipase/acyl hydrolase
MSRKMILSIDGGGIRGQFDLEIISFIEIHFGKKIYELFDMVIGVSAGAITAGFIALHKYVDIKDINQGYEVILENQQSFGPIFECKYDGRGKTNLLKERYENITLGSIEFPLVILTSTIDGEPVLFTSWNPQDANLTLAEVVDASTSSPVYFPPVKIRNTYYIDGAVVSNDPVLAGIKLAREKWGNDINIAVLSLGTGIVDTIEINDDNHPRQFGLLKWLTSGLIDIATRSNLGLYVELIPMLIGKGNYLRVTSTVAGYMDDSSIEMKNALVDNAKDIFTTYGDVIIEWIESKQLNR